MSPLLMLAAVIAPVADTPKREEIVVTASREPVEARSMIVPATVVTAEEYEGLGLALGYPMAVDLLRTVPGVAVSVSGPRGSQSQVRIHGAEANHTLLFVDGIRFNDPAAGNEARFELLAGDGLERLDIVRGPQSALWGSEAIGGVISASTGSAPPAGYRLTGLAEIGALDSARVSGQAAALLGKFELVGTAGWLKSDGVDSFDGKSERDGFENRSASLKAVFRPNEEISIGAVGHLVEGQSEFDGFDPATFRRADTLDATDNRLAAGRLWVEAERSGWTVKLEGSFLGSSNRNLLAGLPLNRTSGRRFTAGGQISKAAGGHRLTLAAEHQGEDFRARDQAFFGASDQDRTRDLDAVVGEWQAEWRPWLTTNVALRHDRFSAFGDATTLRAGATLTPTRRLSLLAGYGDGIAQPSFYDLYGFYPGSFTGNPGLRPERGKEWHAGARWTDNSLSIGLDFFTARLSDEILDVFDPTTFRSTTVNAAAASRRRGLEADAQLRLSHAARLRLSYAYLDAQERQSPGVLALREVRRPRNQGTLAGNGELGRLAWGASVSYVGARGDTDFDQFPAQAVTLGDYVLASLRLGWRISPAIQAYVRAENAFDAEYQDVVGYNTAGRTVHAGLRFSLGD